MPRYEPGPGKDRRCVLEVGHRNDLGDQHADADDSRADNGAVRGSDLSDRSAVGRPYEVDAIADADAEGVRPSYG